jgi:hypothetical protein
MIRAGLEILLAQGVSMGPLQTEAPSSFITA